MTIDDFTKSRAASHSTRLARRPIPGEVERDGLHRDSAALNMSNVILARGRYTVNGSGITIAVLDTGIRHTHQRFRRSNNETCVVKRVNMTADNLGHQDDAWDGDGHGTHVAGLAVAMAPGADIVAVKVLPCDGTTSSLALLITGLQWVEQHASEYHISVVCLSLGDTGNYKDYPVDLSNPSERTDYDHVVTIIHALTSRHIAVVAAAGNRDANNVDAGMNFPAILPACISVGALSRGEPGAADQPRRASTSAWLPDNMYRLGTTIFAAGDDIHSAGIRSDIALTEIHGTSQAAPLVAGAVALMQQYYRRRNGIDSPRSPLPTVQELKHYLRIGAQRLVIEEPLPQTQAEASRPTELCLLDVCSTLDAMPLQRLAGPVGGQRAAGHHAQTAPDAGEPATLAPVVHRTTMAAPRSTTIPDYHAPIVVALKVANAGHNLLDECRQLLSRPLNDPLARGPAIPVRLETCDEADADHVIVRTSAGITATMQPNVVRPLLAGAPEERAIRIAGIVVEQLCMASGRPRDAAIGLLGDAQVGGGKLQVVAQILGDVGVTTKTITDMSSLRNASKSLLALCIALDHEIEQRLFITDAVLWAKRQSLPVILLPAASVGPQVVFPHIGHLTMMPADASPGNIARAVLQHVLRALHFHLRVAGLATLTDQRAAITSMSRPPELIDGDSCEGVIIYPEPPLSRVDRDLLRQHHPHLRLATPTMMHNQILSTLQSSLLADWSIALSMSYCQNPSASLDRYDFDTLVVELSRYLLLSGATLSYGGRPPDDANGRMASQTPSECDMGYHTDTLHQLVREYSTTADRSTWLRWYRPEPFPAVILDAPLKVPGVEQIHAELPVDARHMLVDMNAKEYARARGLDAVRESISSNVQAQVVLGGKLRNFNGRFPGVLHEAYLALKADRPTYVIGAFGGVAHALGRMLFDNDHHAVSEQMLAQDEPGDSENWTRHYAKICVQYQSHPHPIGLPQSVDDMVNEICQQGSSLRAGAETTSLWTNGLTTSENLRLFNSWHVEEIVTLIVRGLNRVRMRSFATARPLPVRLYNGSVGDAVARSEIYLLGTFAGVPPTMIAALPPTLQQRLHLAQQRGELDLPLGECRLIRTRNDTACILGLGELVQWYHLSEEAAQRQLAEVTSSAVSTCIQAGLRSITTVVMGASMKLNVEQRIAAIIDGSLWAWQDADGVAHFGELTLCEREPATYDKVKTTVIARKEHVLLIGELKGSSKPVGVAPQPGAVDPHVLNAALIHDVLYLQLLTNRSTASVPTVSVELDQEQLHSLVARPDSCDPAQLHQSLTSWLCWPGLDRAALFDALGELYGDEPQADEADHNDAAAPLIYLCTPETSTLPVEALHIGRTPLATRASITRKIALPGACPARWKRKREADGTLSMLVVANPTNDLPQAELEAQWLAAWCREHHDLTVDVLLGFNASLANITDRLASGRFDLFHYAGHAIYDPNRTDGGGLLCSNGLVFTTKALDQLDILPFLAFINACDASAMDHGRAGATPRTHRGLAEEFLRVGLNHYVGPHWRVSDQDARSFSQSFYDKLFRGHTLGHALVTARRTLMDQGSSSWPAYVCYGHHNFRV